MATVFIVDSFNMKLIHLVILHNYEEEYDEIDIDHTHMGQLKLPKNSLNLLLAHAIFSLVVFSGHIVFLDFSLTSLQ